MWPKCFRRARKWPRASPFWCSTTGHRRSFASSWLLCSGKMCAKKSSDLFCCWFRLKEKENQVFFLRFISSKWPSAQRRRRRLTTEFWIATFHVFCGSKRDKNLVKTPTLASFWSGNRWESNADLQTEAGELLRRAG